VSIVNWTKKIKTKMIIKIENYPDLFLDYSDASVKSLIVKIGNKYFKRNDKSIVKVGTRFFRRNSKLISTDYFGDVDLTKEMTEVFTIARGLGEKRHSIETIMVSRKNAVSAVTTNCGRRTLKDYSICIGNTYYLPDDPALVLDDLTLNYTLLSETVIVERYGMNVGSSVGTLVEGKNVIRTNRRNPKIFQCKYSSKFYVRSALSLLKILSEGGVTSNFQISKEYEEEYKSKNKLKSVLFLSSLQSLYDYYLDEVLISESDKDIVFSRRLRLHVPAKLVSDMEKSFDAFMLKNEGKTNKPYLAARLQEISDSGYDPGVRFQNNPTTYTEAKGRHSGGEFNYKAKNRQLERSISTRRTGGIGYTFGVEFETADGQLPHLIAESLGTHIMTDGSLYHDSIGCQGFEYVTKPLHGSKGIANVKRICEQLRKHTITSTKCSTHIHVGGATFPDGTESDKPIFSREFSARALSLGIQVEDELFRLLPGYRNPKSNRYCASIKRFKDIIPLKKKLSKEDLEKSKEAYAKTVAAFKAGKSSKSSLLSLKPSKKKMMFDHELADMLFGIGTFDKNHNSRSQLNRWVSSRYYWLNLVNCNTDNSGHRSREGGFKTIEFRAFPPSHNNDDVMFYILFSLAFVWFCENRPSLVLKGGVTLNMMFTEAISDKSSLKFTLDYINKQTDK
jgi:hypothetical protein